ncbi:MAG: CPBP family intramembrane metalloprotease [Paludibacter sp.]|nr:CPBP family intramembrane metalloprotease [Paludibacter sp.]MDD4197985.1 CPBP family intramembrane metalloprotease [Paludibacter sp.]MDD4427618.1 CPBP family intramembrane metalloprotease [Paludibacter sp.]
MKIKGLLHNSNLGSRILQLTGVSLFFMLLFSLISLWITQGDLSDINSIKLAQFMQSLGLFVIPPFLLAYLWSEKPLQYLRIDSKPLSKDVILAVIIMLSAVPAINLLGEINHAFPFPDSLSWFENQLVDLEKRAEDLTLRMLDVDNPTGLLINLGLIAIIPAVGEELFFRGIIQPLLQNKLKAHAAVWITAIIFSAIHLQFFGFIPRMLMGALLGYLFLWTGNIWVPVVAHFTNNAAAVLFYYFKGDGAHALDLENIGKSETYFAGIISMVLVLLLIYYFRKQTKRFSAV